MSIEAIRAELERMAAIIATKRDSLDSLLRSIRETIQKLDELPADVIELLVEPMREKTTQLAGEAPDRPTHKASGADQPTPSKTQYQRLVEFFVDTKNKPAPIRVLGQAIKTRRNAVSTVIYRTHREFFASHPAPGSPKWKLWSLRPDVYQRAYLRLRGASTKPEDS